jgi:CRISPR-associated protein Cst2
MSHVTGVIVVDAPASALNNAGRDEEARTENAVAVKFIRTPEGRYPYVSAQAVRYWLRTLLAHTDGWTASVRRPRWLALTSMARRRSGA